MKYLTVAKHSSFAVVIRTCPVPVQLKPSFCKLFPFLLKDFRRVFDRIKSRDLICICLTRSKIITLVDVFVYQEFMSFWTTPKKVHHPTTFSKKVTSDPCLNLPEHPFLSRYSWTWYWFISDNAALSSCCAPTKLVPWSDLSYLTAPLRLMKRLNALIKEELSSELAVSRWTLLEPIHVNNTP